MKSNRLLALPLIAAGLISLCMPVAAPAGTPASCGVSNPDKSIAGSFDRTLIGAYVLVPFEVPDNQTRLRVSLCHDQAESAPTTVLRHTLDLGVYQPTSDGFHDDQEFRGWGGSSRLNVILSPERATPGFIPGPIVPGRWAAEIGVASIVDISEGDSNGKVEWLLQIDYSDAPSDADEPWVPTPYNVEPARAGWGWYKGDMHVHADHSNGATMQETFDFAFKAIEEGGAGLDFLTLSDYVTTRHWDEIGRYQSQYEGNLIIRSAEVITYRGHINNHASVRWQDYRTGPIYVQESGNLQLIRGSQPPSGILSEIKDAGGWNQINHPTTFPSKVPGFDKYCRGCSWEHSDADTNWALVDSIEVSTGPGGYTDPKGEEPGPNPFSPPAIALWDDLVRRGFDITAVGSSDSHRAHAEALTYSPVGEATTVVYANGLSEASIRDAILKGHAYVKFFSSDGPDLRFEARTAGGETVMMGDELAAPNAHFSARVFGGRTSYQPRTLLVFRDGIPILSTPVTSNDFVFEFNAFVKGNYRLQLQRGTAIEALTNPITLQ